MGSRRRNLVVLLFVVGLVAVSGLIIVQKETKLGLDLQGGLELVYQGQATRVDEEVSGEDIDQSISIIEERINELGVSEPEVARLGTDEITVSLPGVTDARRAEEQVGSTAQLYYFDWQANLIGPEKAIGGNPGLEPPPGPLKASEKRWEDAGRSVTKELNQQLIRAGAYPTAYDAALLASEQEPVENCEECSVARPRYYLFEKNKPHDLIAGPELAKKDLYISPTGDKRPKTGTVIEIPPGTILVSEYPTNESGQLDESVEPGWYALKDEPALSGNDITDPEQTFEGATNQPVVSFNFTDEGQDAFQEVTRRIAQRGQANAIGPVSGEEAEALSHHFAVILENEVKTRPIINFSELPDGIDGRNGAQISGGFQDIQEAQDLATTLQIGALPINLKLISQTQVSATLGSEALDQGITAGLIGLVLAILFLLVFYRFLGLIATIGLIAYGVIFFALINLIPITLTLPGIAGLVLTIGVAADSNIVIFERIKEEVRAGRSMSSAIAAGYRHGISTIIDANVLTLLTAFILFVLATAGVKGFAFTLGVGTIVSLLTAVVFTQALLGNMSRSRLLRSRAFLGASGEGKQWHFDFIGASRWFFSISGLILVVGGLALATQQLNFGIDFESGTRIKVALEQPTDEEGVREALEGAGVAADGEIQQVDDPNLGSNVFQIQSHQLEPSEVRKAETTLIDEFGVAQDGFDSTSVGPTFGQQVADSAITALIFSLLVICGYIALRFEPKFAIPVLIALLHDVLITAGVYSLTGKEVSSGTVAAFLTILGYSIYDTIIVFDRIRENIPRMPRAAFSQIVNRSMSEVLTRSLAAGFTTLLGVTSLMIFGGAVLQDFAFAMLVGIASGTYSSIFIAAPVLNAWKEREPGFIRRRLRIAEVEGGHVPAYADEIETAKLGRDDEPERATKPSVEEPAAEAAPGAVATVERTEIGNGSGSLGDGDEDGAEDGDGDAASTERQQRNAERRARRKARKKHGRR
jgi:SecD/SecF fusion protein